MLFLADESCDFAVVRSLRGAGHDVVAVAEVSPRADDEAVRELAQREQRILLTEDKDFGQLVYADEHANRGVILIRYPSTARAALPKAILKLVTDRGQPSYRCSIMDRRNNSGRGPESPRSPGDFV